MAGFLFSFVWLIAFTPTRAADIKQSYRRTSLELEYEVQIDLI